ncbi:MAG: hypothetical protein ACI4TJ_02215 [Candidatus Cryptobacteroides sp.]
MELKIRAETGERVSRKELGGLYESLLDLRSQRRSGTGTMTAEQRRRFDRIKERYSFLFGVGDSGKTDEKDIQSDMSSSASPSVKAPPRVSRPKVSSPVPAVTMNDSSAVTDSSVFERPSFPVLPRFESSCPAAVLKIPSSAGTLVRGHSLTGQIQVLPSRNRHLSASIVACISPWPEMSFGGAVSIFANNCGWGGYARFRSNFASSSWSYLSYSDGSCEGGYFWPSGNRKVSLLHSSIGVRRNFGSRFAFMAGAGYGRKTVLWEDIDNNWSKVNDLSASGLCLECGPACGLGPLELQLLVSTLNFRSASLEFAFGLRF